MSVKFWQTISRFWFSVPRTTDARWGNCLHCTPIFYLPHRPKFSDIFGLCLHWVSVVRARYYCNWWNIECTYFRLFPQFLHRRILGPVMEKIIINWLLTHKIINGCKHYQTLEHVVVKCYILKIVWFCNL